MYSEDQITLNLLSTFISSTSTVANATVDLGPYFNVNRREVAMVYTYGVISTSSETITFRLEGADSTATANSTAVTFTGVTNSTVTMAALGASLVGLNMTTVQPLTLTQRYLRAAVVGSASTANVYVSIAVVLIRRNAF